MRQKNGESRGNSNTSNGVMPPTPKTNTSTSATDAMIRSSDTYIHGIGIVAILTIECFLYITKNLFVL